MKPSSVFLSYAREDADPLEALYQSLRDAGLQPWMDTKDLLPGQDWSAAIARAIRRCDFFVACLSTRSVQKRGEVQREIKQALALWEEKLDDDIYLIPLRLDDCEIPEPLRRFQWVDLFRQPGFSRLLESLMRGELKRNEASAPRAPAGGVADTGDRRGFSPLPKFYFYISRPKVEMLLPQVEDESPPRAHERPIAANALRLAEALQRRGLLSEVQDGRPLSADTFYLGKGPWRNGLYYFRTLASTTVAYFLWRQYADQLVVLAGSPEHLIGHRVADEGVTLSSSGEAIETLGSSQILELIQTDESPWVTLQARDSAQVGSNPIYMPPSHRALGRFDDDVGSSPYTGSPAIGLAVFCMKYLVRLPRMSIETVFRIYSTSTAQHATLLEDLEAEHSAGRERYPSLYTHLGLDNARRLGLQNVRAVHIGSPIWTAIG